MPLANINNIHLLLCYIVKYSANIYVRTYVRIPACTRVNNVVIVCGHEISVKNMCHPGHIVHPGHSVIPKTEGASRVDASLLKHNSI